MDRLADFVIIGAMKSATTTLHEQLALQPGLFMSQPKEPGFFSDDPVFARGIDSYASVFRDAPGGALCGESSTHYSMLPTYPNTVSRMAEVLPQARLIYVMRHPVDRFCSHYVHEKTAGRPEVPIGEAVDEWPELVAYGRYAWQLEPWLEAFGTARILPVFFDRLVRHSQVELERIGRFLGMKNRPVWDLAMKPQNVGSERLRPSALRQVLVTVPVLTPLRQRLVPRRISDRFKTIWRARFEPPALTSTSLRRLREVFDADLARLGEWLGVRLDCENFHDVTAAQAHDWQIRR